MSTPAPVVSTVGVWPARGRGAIATTHPARLPDRLGGEPRLADGRRVFGADSGALVTRGAPPRPAGLLQADADGRLPADARVGGVTDQVHEHVVQRVRVALEINLLEREVELERDFLVLEDAALERAAGADHAYGVEPLRARQRAPGAVLDGTQEVDPAVDIVDDLTQLVEHLEPPRGGDLGPAAQGLHGELQAGARRRQRIRHLVRDDPRQRGQVLQRVRPLGNGCGWQLATVEQPEAEARELEREALPAAALPPLGGRRRRAGAHRGDQPVPLRGTGAYEAAALDDLDAPAPQRGVDVELAVVMGRGGGARSLGLELGARRHFPHRDGPAAQRDARLPQDLAPALNEGLWSAHRGSAGHHRHA